MRKQARETAFKMIFENLFRNSDAFNEECFFSAKEDAKLTDEDEKFSIEIFKAYLSNKNDLIEKIKPALRGYEFDRAYKIDTSLILLALAEIYFVGTDKKIVINEVVDISKKYSTEKSPSFINGVLSTLVNNNG